jgi:tetratricopeptide (TPR) repeat protein
MTNDVSGRPGTAVKMVVLAAAGSLVLVLVMAFVQRMVHPELTRQVRHGDPGAVDTAGQEAMGRITEFMARLQENPDDLEAMLGLGTSFMRMQAWDRALVFWNRALGIDPVNAQALNQKGVTLFQLDRFQEAGEVFQELLVAHPRDVRAHYNLGMLYKYFLQQPERATGHFQDVVRLADDDPELLQEARKELDSMTNATDSGSGSS